MQCSKITQVTLYLQTLSGYTVLNIRKKYLLAFGTLALLCLSGCVSTKESKTITYNFSQAATDAASKPDIFSVPNVSFSGTAVFETDSKKQKLQFMAVRQNENIKLKLFTGLAGSVMELVIKDGSYMAAFSGTPELFKGTALTDRIRIPQTHQSLPVCTLLYAFCPQKEMDSASETKVGADRVLTATTPGGIIRKLKKQKDGTLTQQAFSGNTAELSVLYTNWNTSQNCRYPKQIHILDAKGKTLAELRIKKCIQKETVGQNIFDEQAFERSTHGMRTN